MAQEILLYLSLTIAVVAVFTILARIIKQPPIIAYLIAGIVVGPLVFNLIGPSSPSSELMQTFAHIGVALLLFIVGLSLDFRLLKEVGKVAVVGGLAQIILSGVLGYLFSAMLGFSPLTSVYLALALAFSSTVVVVKILSDKKEIDTLHGKIALGILIIQDFVAAIALMVLPLVQSKQNLYHLLSNIGIIFLLIIAVFLVSFFILNRFLNYLARNQEVLFLFGIAWALILATLFDYFGFSLEIGALIAGISLASSKYTLELGGKIKPLRDFFVVLFFVFFGSQLSTSVTYSMIKTALLFSAFVLIAKPLIVMIILRVFGYKKRTNFLAGSSLAQISEFSLILALLGFSLGHVSRELMSLMILISIITIGVSSYGLYYSNWIFSKLARMLALFEGKKLLTKENRKEDYEVVLFGYHRLGYKIMETLKKMKVSFVVVDYNPKVVLSLGKAGINCIYGDAGDKDFLSQMDLRKVKLIISTIPDESSNLIIKERIREIGSKATFMATAEQPRSALDLYAAGVDYVIVPHHLGGELISTIIEAFETDHKKYKKLGQDHRRKLSVGKNSSTF